MIYLIRIYLWSIVGRIACEFHIKPLLKRTVIGLNNNLSRAIEALPKSDLSELQFVVAEFESLERDIA